MPKFSIVSPVWLDKEAPENKRQPRYEMFLRTANSVFGQTFQDFEWVIVDDISRPPIEDILEKHDSWWSPRGLKVKVIRLPEKGGRIIARNEGMKVASGEWIIWLDSDDELSSMTLEALDKAIKTYPKYKIFNFNHLIFHYDYKVSVRKFIDMEKQGKAPFGSGNIGAGAFVFHKDVFKKVGPLPELGLWDFSADFLEKHPETKPFFESSEQPGKYHSLGNPWGEDYAFFYKITREFDCKYLDSAFYYVHSRFGHKWPEEKEFDDKQGAKPQWNSNNR